ncbi:hypothetical protein BG015_008034 [Linnemannia schmuckeri]|uniref:Uncharacterized protein n=1 Tax=Linnemannia schmuckeri TaxID=64567 RepID=A0A9P5VAN0_9FUNG|nr:hypothetical protein BG015_008034 [Linnemannia schmuckeri]
MSSIEHLQLLQQFKAQTIKITIIYYKHHGTIGGIEPVYGEDLENNRRTLKSLCLQSEGNGYNAKKEMCIDDIVSALLKKATGTTSAMSAAAPTNNNVLTSMTLYCCSMSREMFYELLQCSPNLTNLCVQRVFLVEYSSFPPSSSNTDFFQSDSARYLDASGIQVLRLSNDVNREVIDPPTLHLLPKSENVLRRFEALERILRYQETLTSICLKGSIYEWYFDGRRDGTGGGPEELFNRITRWCSRLEVLTDRLHVVSIEAFEEGGPWGCKGLQTLRVKVDGTCDKEEIDAYLMGQEHPCMATC